VTKRMSAKDAREHFADVLGLVYYGKEPIIVERKGKPMAVLISPEQYARYEHQIRERFGQVLDELHEINAGTDPAEVQRDVDAAIAAVRREQHEPQQPQ
jgi:prevent-host-death family protein